MNMEKPIEPNKDDCCNSGCNPCIFDVYDKQLKLYHAYLEKGEVPGAVTDNAISQLEYTSFKVAVCEELCPAHKILAFRRTDESVGKRVFWNPGDHFLIKYNFVSGTCTRAYTPISYRNDEFDSDFVIIVKNYASGIVSDYLCNLLIGEETFWRGPYGSFEIIPNKFNRMIMIAQGTGIAPLYSIIQSILKNEDDFTKIILLFCCSNQETILFRNELYTFKSYWNFSYSVFVRLTAECVYKYQEPIVNRKLEFKDINSLNPFSVKDQFLICGASLFMNEFKTHLLNVDNVPIDNIITF